MPTKKLYNGGRWTEARFNAFIKSALRSASMRWPPKNEVKKKARLRRGYYKCNACKKEVPASLPPKPGNKRRINNAVVDHIKPVVDPKKGFISWDDTIKRMFVEEKGLQVLCHACHTKKTEKEKAQAKRTRAAASKADR